MVARKKRVLLVGLLVALAAGEAGVRIGRAAGGLGPPSLDPSQENEWQWAFEHLRKDHLFEGLGAYHPVLGHVTRPNLDQEDVRTNSAGFRAEREFSRERTPGVPRLLLLGDSYTFGYRVSNEDAWAAVLARRFLPGWEVLNLGVCGYGTDQAVLSFEEIGADYSPDVVVLGIFVRDFMRNLLDFNGYIKPRFQLGAGGELERAPIEMIPPEQLLDQYRSGQRSVGRWYQSQLATSLVASLEEVLRRRAIDETSDSWKLMAALLRRFRDDATAAGARPFVLVFPERLDKHLGSHWQTIDRLIVRESHALGVPVLSLTEAFRAEEARHPETPLNPAHLSVRGNEYAAELLFDALREAGLVGER